MYNLDSIAIIEKPYPHIFLNEFNKDSHVTDLLKNIPDMSKFSGIGRSDTGYTFILDGSENKIWTNYNQKVINFLYTITPSMVEKIEKKRSKLRKLGLKHGDLVANSGYICITNPQRGLPFHTDSEEWAFVAVSNLGYLNLKKSPVINFYDSKNKLYTQYENSRTSIMVFFNDDTIHGVQGEVSYGRISHVVALEFK